MANLKYRPDIDGLRAFAVLIVIIFHFDKTLLPGGFIGVDIFFVISGFIITCAIYPQILSQSFSFSRFYEKRIKRILPLFYLVIFTSLVAAYFLFTPNDFSSFADSMRYSNAIISNVYFERNTGYFANTSETMPLLNIWSLSVEEQFYLLWPVLLLGATRFLSKKKAAALFITSLVVLASYSHFLAITSPSQAYFLIQSRGFELLIGALLAIFVLVSREKNIAFSAQIYAISGITGVAITLVMLATLDKTSLFPGYNAAIVCLGAALIIFSGTHKNTLLSTFLSTPFMVRTGRLSYSLYLWHWPIQSFYRYYYGEFGVKGFIICSTLTLLFSVLSLRFIENPLRYANIKKRDVYIFYFLIPITAFILLAKHIEKNEGYPDRFDGQALQLYLSSISEFETDENLRASMEGFPPFSAFVIGNQSAKEPSVFMWGDSHSQHFQGFVDELGKAYGFSALISALGSCPPIAEGGLVKNGRPEKDCETKNKATLKSILKSDVKIVFLGGRWGTYSQTTLEKNEEGSRVYLGDESDQSQSIENSRRVLTKGMELTISTLIKAGKTPIIFTQVPAFQLKPSNCLFKKQVFESMKDLSCDIDKKTFEDRQDFANTFIFTLKEKYPEMIIIDTQPLMCMDDVCKSEIDGQPLYKDNNHLNNLGAIKIYHEYMKTPQAHELKKRLEEIPAP